MRILPEPVYFEWDKGNINKNLKRHEVTNQGAEEVFSNDPKFIFEDTKHSVKEKRFGLFGQTNEGRKLSIIFTKRKDKVRIVTARDMSRKERKAYEKIKTNSKI